MTSIAQQIRGQREVKRLSQNSLAYSLGLSIHEYCDIEDHEDELVTNVRLSTAKALCQLLDLDILDVLGISCTFCSGDSEDPRWQLSRDILFRRARDEAGVSLAYIAEAIGYEVDAVAECEAREDALESWTIEAILQIAKILNASPKMLIGVRCSRCGR